MQFNYFYYLILFSYLSNFIAFIALVHEIRDLGGIIFVIIRDRDGLIQVTAPSKKVDAEILADLRALRKESVVAIKGTAQEAGKAPNGVEIIRVSPHGWHHSLKPF